MVEAEVQQWGNEFGFVVSSGKIKELGLHKGDKIEIAIIQKKRIDGFGWVWGG